MLLSEYYCESIYKENGANYEVLVAGKNQRDKFLVRCNICLIESTVAASSILSGRKPCLCSNKAYSTPERKMARMLDVVKTKNIKLLSGNIPNAKAPLEVLCLVCNNKWNSSYNSLCLQDRGCHYCNGTYKKSESYLTEEIQIITSGRFCKVESVAYKEGLSRDIAIHLSCCICGLNWKTSAGSILKGSGCPLCAKTGFQESLPAVLYLLRVVSQENTIIGYKYGITLDLEQRIKQHNKACKYLGITFVASYIWPYDLGYFAKKHEKNIKKNFSSYFQKYELPSGYTESISPEMFGELVDFQTEQYNRKELWQE